MIIFESLDQLSDVLSGRLLNWLLVDGFSGEVHIVTGWRTKISDAISLNCVADGMCSTLPDEPNPKVGRPWGSARLSGRPQALG